jgi:hypothetical protein
LLSKKQVIMVLTSKSDIHVFSTLGLSNCCDILGLRGGSNMRLHSEELHEFYSSPNIYSGDQVSENEVGWPCGLYGDEEICVQSFGGKHAGEKLL